MPLADLMPGDVIADPVFRGSNTLATPITVARAQRTGGELSIID